MSSNNRPHITIYKPQPYQMEVHRGLAAHWHGSIHVVKAVRQCGKSLMCENILIKASFEHGGTTSIMVSPTFSQAKKVFKDIVKAVPRELIASKNGSDLEVEFANGSQILFKSAEQRDNLRGFTVSKYGVLIIDEAAYVTDEVFYLCTPFVNASNAPIVIVSTPRFKSGFFYDFFVEEDDNVWVYDFSKHPNPYLTQERLEMYRRKMPVNLFRSDYLGEWMEAMSDVFGDFKKVLSNTVTNDGGSLTAGIDWGVGKGAKSEDSDQTSLSIFNSMHQQVRLYHWNDLDETETIKRIVQALREMNVGKVVVETNSIGGVYLGLLRKAIMAAGIDCQVIEFTTTNDTKREIIEHFVVEVQNRACQLLDDPEQSIQMSAYQMERTPTGKITYNAAKGYHDDCIIATALAMEGLRTASYNIL